MKVSLKKGFEGNCILGQEAANSTSEEILSSLSLECKIGYSMAQKGQFLT